VSAHAEKSLVGVPDIWGVENPKVPRASSLYVWRLTLSPTIAADKPRLAPSWRKCAQQPRPDEFERGAVEHLAEPHRIQPVKSGMKLASLALLALVAACSAPAATAHPAASLAPVPALPQPAISAAASSPPSPTWTLGLGSTAISMVTFSCRLPVLVDHADQRPGGAFIDFPSGAVTVDPSAANVPSLPGAGREFVGDTFYVHYYDRAYSRWVPVRRKDVSPDGSHYAFTDRAVANQQDPPTRANLHVVDVKTGQDLSFDDGPWSSPYVILDYAAEGIYLAPEYTGYGIWMMDPATGAINQVADPWDVQGSSGNKIFWTGVVSPADPQPINGLAPDEVDRLNLGDGIRTPWFYRPGTSAHFVTQDVEGDPVIVASGVSGPEEWWLAPSPSVARPIWISGNGIPSISDPIADSHGVWFGGPDGIFLYSEAGGVQKVSNQPGYPGNGCI